MFGVKPRLETGPAHSDSQAALSIAEIACCTGLAHGEVGKGSVKAPQNSLPEGVYAG